MEEFYNFKTTSIDRQYKKNPEDKDKYVVCACAKNEDQYIEEWVKHYLSLGFDKIFICDNNDTNVLEDILAQYISDGVVEIFDCRGFGSFQVQFYSMFCSEGNYKWCGYFDCDEFLELGMGYSNIKDYLSTKENETCVSFNWMVYGSNGENIKKEGGVQERFPYPVSPISIFTENCFVKSIVKGGNTFSNGCWFNGSHIPMTTPMYEHNVGGYFKSSDDSHNYFPPRYKEGYIKHYYTKSFEEWINKASRGWPDGTANLYAQKYFICQDWANLPIKQMTDGLFLSGDGIESFRENYKNTFEEYDVIHVTNSNRHIYALLMGAFRLMYCTTNHTFCFSDEHIDDTTFNILLEYGIKTGNNVIWAPTHNDVWRTYLKYNTGKNFTYFILNFM